MSNKYAVIDLGTNTFHLLIAQVENGKDSFKVIYKERRFVKLAEEGIETIGEKALKRGLDALMHFHSLMQEHHVKEVRAVGTAALRTASNGPLFVAEVKKRIGLDISLINGFQEAELIAKGVRHAIPDLQNERYLIIDIGGGSVEFIIAQQGAVVWKGSFMIGVALLSNLFQNNDPIKAEEVAAITNHLKQHLRELTPALNNYPCRILVGASGTFDVLENFIQDREQGDTYSRFRIALFHPLYQKLLSTTVIDRMRTPEIPLERVEMLIPALILVHTVVEIAQIQEIIVSDYALKEGVLSEMLNTE
jgi:exopolyphosphatase/guanosine-5'-triphosphate,3'-diphosphate pyrophosphatase